MLDKTQQMNEYLDFYESLLTKKQIEVLSYYYRENYSYTEIADILKISRTAVYDTIKRTETILQNYEEKMELLARYKQRRQCYDQLIALKIKEVSKLVSQCLETE